MDTNVPVVANYTKDPSKITEDLLGCVTECINRIQRLTETGGLVLDDGGEIFDEYTHSLSRSGQPGVGDKFLKWTHDNQWNPRWVERVPITPKNNSYSEFPLSPDISELDIDDHKFISVSNAHPEKPPILQATDSKWWLFRDALARVGITVEFLCEEYVILKLKKRTW